MYGKIIGLIQEEVDILRKPEYGKVHIFGDHEFKSR
jgi:hypothetical protein